MSSSSSSTVGGGGANRPMPGGFFITLRDKPERTASATEVIARLRAASRRCPGSPPSSSRCSRSRRRRLLLDAPIPVLAASPRHRRRCATRRRKRRGADARDPRPHRRQLRPADQGARRRHRDRPRQGLEPRPRPSARSATRSMPPIGTAQISTIYAPEDTYSVILEADPKFGTTAEMLRKLTHQGRQRHARPARQRRAGRDPHPRRSRSPISASCRR